MTGIILSYLAGAAACLGIVITYHDAGRRHVAHEIIRITPGANPAQAERVALFYIGETEHTMLVHPRPSLTFEYMDMVRERGLDAAIAMCIGEVLGQKSWDALKKSPDVTDEQVAKIMEIVMENVLGRAGRPEGPKATGSNGQAKSGGSRKLPTKS